jgi:hypothetical protein
MKSPFYFLRFLPSMPWLEIIGFAALILFSQSR